MGRIATELVTEILAGDSRLQTDQLNPHGLLGKPG